METPRLEALRTWKRPSMLHLLQFLSFFVHIHLHLCTLTTSIHIRIVPKSSPFGHFDLDSLLNNTFTLIWLPVRKPQIHLSNGTPNYHTTSSQYTWYNWYRLLVCTVVTTDMVQLETEKDGRPTSLNDVFMGNMYAVKYLISYVHTHRTQLPSPLASTPSFRTSTCQFKSSHKYSACSP